MAVLDPDRLLDGAGPHVAGEDLRGEGIGDPRPAAVANDLTVSAFDGGRHPADPPSEKAIFSPGKFRHTGLSRRLMAETMVFAMQVTIPMIAGPSGAGFGTRPCEPRCMQITVSVSEQASQIGSQ
jgi:hypothetical protein